jgi:hypothetical protein
MKKSTQILRNLSFLLILSTFGAALGCGGAADLRVLRTTELQGADALAQGFVGITIAPDTGERFLLHDKAGIYRLSDVGELELLVSNDELRRSADFAPTTDFTDIAALGGSRFGLIAANDGFLYDHRFGQLSLHFCYEPGFIEPEPGEPAPVEPGPDPVPTEPNHRQISLSLSYDAIERQLVAQPRTFDEETGELLAAHIATFAVDSGVEQGWYSLPDSHTLAGGIALEDTNHVLLGEGHELHRFQVNTRESQLVADLSSFVDEITGMAQGIDGRVLVLDGVQGTVLELDLP